MRGVSVDVGLQRLAVYAREHGHVNPPVRTMWLDWAIGLWVRELRAKKRRDDLTPEQIAEAESLGLDWNPPPGRPRTAAPRVSREQRREARLHASLDRLIPYWQEHGDINVRQLLGTDDWPQAGRFIGRLRADRRQETLPPSVEERATMMGAGMGAASGSSSTLTLQPLPTNRGWIHSRSRFSRIMADMIAVAFDEVFDRLAEELPTDPRG